MLELLAPAGDMQSFDTAIRCGADAIYLGLDNFNARMKADNFGCDNIFDVVKRAHFYGVKVYITLNTILQNQELSDMISLVKVAIASNVDAFIVQDLGVAKILKECFDGIVLHASTQMGIHNLYGAKIAEKLGFRRVVLSRETKLEDIREIAKNTNLEIEYFVQGALCIAFSGNCYLSSCEHNASGNRGLCKQLCRLPYEAQLGQMKTNGYLLSARDLSLANSLSDLVDAGVVSFKIEGRMRRAEYVGEAVSVYRKLLDNLKTKLSKDDAQNLKIAYSRGEYLSRAYLDNGTPKIVEKRFANHTGIQIGKVVSVRPFKQDLFEVKIVADRELKNGDGLKFFDGDKEIASLGVGDVKKDNGLYVFVTKTRVKQGQIVNLISAKDQSEFIKNQTRTNKISLDVDAVCGQPLTITATYKTGNLNDSNYTITVCKAAQSVLEKAQNMPMSENDIKAQCCKTADSGFEVASINVNTDGVFVAKSVINNLRRSVLDELKERIVESNLPSQVEVYQDKIENVMQTVGALKQVAPKRKLKFVSSEDIFQTDIIAKDEMIVLSPNVYSNAEIEKMLSILGVPQEQVALELPIIANSRDLRVLENLLSSLSINTLVSENIYGLYFADKGYNIVAGQGHNLANIYAMYCVKSLGASAVIPSLEYPNTHTNEDIILASANKNLPMMTFAHCPYKTIFDNDCSKCTYRQGLTLKNSGKTYKIRRVVVDKCYFQLLSSR